MNKIIKYIWAFFIFFHAQYVLADKGILDGVGSESKLRTGDIHTSDIPNIIKGAIDYAMGFAGTIAVIFIIVGGYQLMFGTLEGETSKGKKTIIMALGGFAIASLSWFIIRIILDNFA